MPVEDVFTITGRGTVATGRVERGTLHLNDEVEIIGIKEDVQKTVVTGIEMFRKLLDEAEAGDNIGALLRGINRDQIQRGQVLAKPGTVTCHTKFKAQVYVLTKTRVVVILRSSTTIVRSSISEQLTLPVSASFRKESRCACLATTFEMTIELIHPIAMEKGLTFAIREGGRTVGSGRVSEIIE